MRRNGDNRRPKIVEQTRFNIGDRGRSIDGSIVPREYVKAFDLLYRGFVDTSQPYHLFLGYCREHKCCIAVLEKGAGVKKYYLGFVPGISREQWEQIQPMDANAIDQMRIYSVDYILKNPLERGKGVEGIAKGLSQVTMDDLIFDFFSLTIGDL